VTEDKRAAGSDSVSIANRLDEFRCRIDELDERIVELLNRRATCANEIGRLKDSVGMKTYQPHREDEVLAHIRSVNDGPLAGDAVTRVFERIIDESRRLERLTSDSAKKSVESDGK